MNTTTTDSANIIDAYKEYTDQKDAQTGHQGVCPNCGYCPYCGRGGGYQPYPWYPQPWYPQPAQPWNPTIICC